LWSLQVLDRLERDKRRRGKGKGGQEDADARSRKEALNAEKRGMAFAIYQNQRRAVNAGVHLVVKLVNGQTPHASVARLLSTLPRFLAVGTRTPCC
jgi:hypothetical protein